MRTEMAKKAARILIAAPKSGSGKTLITCGIIGALKRRKLRLQAFKCGPDYIDPMFHRQVLGVETGNLDSFFTDEDTLRYLLARRAECADVTVIEGVMGYYDGLGGISERASSYDIARITGTPTILVVDARAVSVTLAAIIQGICAYRTDSGIKGVILNRVSAGYYEKLKTVIERECGVLVLGFVPEQKDMKVSKRHLGLTAPEEMEQFFEWADKAADILERYVDMDMLLGIAESAEPLETKCDLKLPRTKSPVTVAIARDEAFSFYYAENIELLERMGAKPVFFSPLRDEALPKGADGLILWGGYPENYARTLSENVSMRHSVRAACRLGMPCLAECGGFLYLQQTLEGIDGGSHKMAGVLPGQGYRTERLCRFGYIEAWQQETDKDAKLLLGRDCRLRGHEFHYWDCTENGTSFAARKLRTEPYECIVHTETIAAGFPHFYYYSNPQAVYPFLEACLAYGEKERG